MDLVASLVGWLPVFLAAVALLAILLRLVDRTPRYARKRFLTEAEARVLKLLEAALPHHRIMAQVSMGALIKADETNRKRAHATRNRFSQKIVDFIVVTRDTAEVVALIELDDRTHSRSKDAKRDAMTSAAGYHTVRIPGARGATVQTVREALMNSIPSFASEARASDQAAIR